MNFKKTTNITLTCIACLSINAYSSPTLQPSKNSETNASVSKSTKGNVTTVEIAGSKGTVTVKEGESNTDTLVRGYSITTSKPLKIGDTIVPAGTTIQGVHVVPPSSSGVAPFNITDGTRITEIYNDRGNGDTGLRDFNNQSGWQTGKIIIFNGSNGSFEYFEGDNKYKVEQKVQSENS